MKMGYLKINSSLITTLIERWKPETHTFHMRCEECTITLQDVSVLLGLRVDGAPLIDQTNLDWAELCEELLGVRPQEGELQGSVVKLSWLAHHFSKINIHDGNIEQLQRFTCAWILRFIGGVLFVDKSSSKVSLRYLQFLRDFEQCSMYAWGPAVLAYLYREMCSATDYKIKSIGVSVGALHNMSALPPICLVGSVAWCAVVPLICFHVVEWHQPDRVLRQFGMQQPIPESPSQPLNIHGLTLKGKQDENWFQLLAPMISEWNNRAEFRVDVYPRQEGLLSFNFDYMVWVKLRRHCSIWCHHKGGTHGQLMISCLMWRRKRFYPKSKRGSLSLWHMVQHQSFDFPHNSFTCFSQVLKLEYPSQMYQYPFEGHGTDMSASEHSFGGVTETHPHFSWPTMTPSQQHDAPMATPNAPLAPQWNVPGAIPDMGDLLGVDLRHEFSAKAEQEGRRQRARRNPDREAKRWDQPCGTSSRYHRHHNE
ncbi:Serine/threonine-protein phosphatase 7 long form [Glycine soja]